jgi:hypothetical protein
MEMTKDAKLMSFTRVFPGLRENLENCPCLGFIFYLVFYFLRNQFYYVFPILKQIFFSFFYFSKKKGKKHEIDKKN